jgi:hypothetical protein
MAKIPRERLVNGEVRKMIGNVEELTEIWDKPDTCYMRPEK